MSSSSQYPGHRRFLPYLINRTTAFLNVEFLRVLEEYSLTLTQWRVLAFLAEEGGLTISALAEATVTDPSTLSRALSSLENRTLVKREPCPDDNRSVRIHLAAQGRAVFQAVLAPALAIQAKAFADVSPEEQELLHHILEKMMISLQRQRES